MGSFRETYMILEVCVVERLTPRTPDRRSRVSSLARRFVFLRQGTLLHFVSLHSGT